MYRVTDRIIDISLKTMPAHKSVHSALQKASKRRSQAEARARPEARFVSKTFVCRDWALSPQIFLTIWMTSSSRSYRALPTRPGLCFTDEPHTHAYLKSLMRVCGSSCRRAHRRLGDAAQDDWRGIIGHLPLGLRKPG